MKIINNNGELYCKITDLLEEIGHLCATTTEEPQETPQKGPFDQQKTGDLYFFVGADGAVDCDSVYGSDLFAVANYCADKELMKQRALHETLNRLLWRYSEQHGGDPEWDGENEHWGIYRHYYTEGLLVDSVGAWKTTGQIYFASEKIAWAAIEEVVEPFMAAHPEFVW